tara:strand:- start:2005 stop:2643 length:639 start_codon:yes stop_codon:yes gene_type:complete
MSNPFKRKEVTNKPLNKFSKEENKKEENIFKRNNIKSTNSSSNQFHRDYKNRDYKNKDYKNRDYKNKNQFKEQNSFKKKEKEFEVKTEEFPELVKNKTTNISQNSYINRLNKEIKETNLKKTEEKPGWSILSLNKKYKTFNKIEDFSEYFNPTGANLIWQNRIKFREDLNDLLGDRSPYWDMSQYEPDFDLNDYEYDENEEEEEEEEYVEDW